MFNFKHLVRGFYFVKMSEDIKWIEELKLDDRLDVFDPTSCVKSWLPAKVIAINDAQIKVHFYGWRSRWDVWINKSNTDILAPCNAHTCKYTISDIEMQNINGFIAADIQHQRSFYRRNAEILQCKMNTFNCECIYSFTSIHANFSRTQYEPYLHNNTLYTAIFDSGRLKGIYSLNLTTDTWSELKIRETNVMDQYHFSGKSTNLMVNGDEIHLFVFTKQFSEIAHLKLQNEGIQFIGQYNNLLTKFSLMKESSMIALLTDINDESGIDFVDIANNNWSYTSFKEFYEDGMLLKSSIIVFESIFVLVTNSGTLFYEMNLKKWYKTDEILLNMNCRWMDLKDNYIHVYLRESNDDVPLKYHMKIYLLDVIPEELINDCKQEIYLKLVHGFVNDKINAFLLKDRFPSNLTEIIFAFFQPFLYV